MTIAGPETRYSAIDHAVELFGPTVRANCALMRRRPTLRRTQDEFDTIDYGLASKLKDQRFKNLVSDRLDAIALRRERGQSSLEDLRIKVSLTWTNESTLTVTVTRLEPIR